MSIYELSQKIPNDNPAKEVLLLAQLLKEAQELKAEVEDMIQE